MSVGFVLYGVLVGFICAGLALLGGGFSFLNALAIYSLIGTIGVFSAVILLTVRDRLHAVSSSRNQTPTKAG